MTRTWFITGAARGLGAGTVRAALAAGDRVVAAGRDRDALIAAFGPPSDHLLPLAMDVTRPEQIEQAVQAAVTLFGRIDVLVNNAGYGHLGMFEETTPQEERAQFDTNVFGLFAVTRAVLPVMRAQRSGRILNISSVGGFIGGESGALYCASKFAVEGFSESVGAEVARFGIRVTVVEPGFFRTDFLEPTSVRYGERTIADYAQASADLRAFYDARSGNQAGDPEKFGQAMAALVDSQDPPTRICFGSDAVGMVTAKIESLTRELDGWRALSLSTDGDFDFRPEATGLTAWG